MSKKTWEEQTILQIRREFSANEKYNLLIQEYDNMKVKVDNYKKQIVKLQGAYDYLKLKYFELDQKYATLTTPQQQDDLL